MSCITRQRQSGQRTTEPIWQPSKENAALNAAGAAFVVGAGAAVVMVMMMMMMMMTMVMMMMMTMMMLGIEARDNSRVCCQLY